MAFELHEPGCFVLATKLESGEVSLDSTGKLTAVGSDFDLVGITDQVAVLVDAETFRIALRAPTSEEAGQSYAVRDVLRKGKPTGRKGVYLSSALRSLGLDPRDVKGRRELNVKGEGKGGLLILSILDPHERE